MIQRKQSVFLMLIDVVLVVLFFVPFASMMGPGDSPLPLTLMDDYVALSGEVGLTIIASLGVVTFKNRPLQMKICVTGAILSLAYTGYLASLPYLQTHTFSEAGTWITMANFVLFMLAWKFIKKDDEMVKSADRIR